MLSFGEKIHTLSGFFRYQTKQEKKVSKESIFRPLTLKGSLAIEAALVVPLFLFFLLTMLSTLQLMMFSVRMQQILFEEGLRISEKIYETEAMDVSRAIGEMQKKLPASGNIPVEGGLSGLDFGACDLSDREFADLSVKYRAKLIFDPFHLFHREFCQHVLFHRWIGYENGLSHRSAESDEVLVYITERSEVYHRSPECTHIRLHIMETSGSSIDEQRNVYGERYSPCRHCHPKKKDTTLYITSDGDCYHNTLTCSGLSRSVRAIPLSKAGDRRPCSRCGY